MKQQIKVTVIVTVHNAEKYLKECLDSVISQTLPDIEILCMDGGSTDCSPEILQEYAKRDHRIKIINDSNTSYGHKVNEGFRRASGQYISVLESDDMYQPDMLERLLSVAEKYHPDYVNADYFDFFDISGRRYQVPVAMYDKNEYGKLLKCEEHLENMKQVLRYWTGIFSKEFLTRNEIQMNESPGASFQDMSFRFLTSVLADTAYHLDVPVYLYRIDNPYSSVYDAKKAVIIADEFDFLKNELIKRNIKNEYIWRHFYIWKYNDFHGNLIRFAAAERRELFERCYQEIKNDKEYLLAYDCQKYSNAISILLDKAKSEVWDQIEKSFRIYQARNKLRQQSYEQLDETKFIIFGCGICGRSALSYLKSIGLERQIECFTDNSDRLWNHSLEGYPIVSPLNTFEKYPNAIYLICIKDFEDEIHQQLLQNGIAESHIYIFQ